VIDESTRRKSTFWRELPILLGVAIVVAVLVRAFLLQTFYIPSESMEHTLNINDRVLVNKLVYDFRAPRRGEIIVFNSPPSWRGDPTETDFIKRVIGVGGDHVTCCTEGKLEINGRVLNESYLNTDDGANLPASPDPFDIVVPKGRLWVMGDNRYHSGDSRDQYNRTNKDIMAATIPVNSVVGRAFVTFWPLDRATWLTVPGAYGSIPSPP
jgi:signal peptidase I